MPPVNQSRNVGRVTIDDVARAAGVSVTTVSYVLNGRTDQVAGPTRQRVERAIHELGYRPNVSARQLRGKRVRSLGLIIHSLVNPSLTSLIRGAEHAAAERGYSLILSDLDREPKRVRGYVDALLAGKVDGIMLTFSSPIEVDTAAYLTARGVPSVAFSPNPERLTIPSVALDNDAGVRDLVGHLLRLGHRQIGFVAHSLVSAHADRRLVALRCALATHGLPLSDEWVVSVDVRTEDRAPDYELRAGQEAARRLRALPHPPTAVLTAHDTLALGVLDGARRLDWRVPDELSVVGFDDIPFAAVAAPPLTTVRAPLYEVGRTAADALIDLLAGGHPPSVVFPTQMMVRSSTAPPGSSPEGALLGRDPAHRTAPRSTHTAGGGA